MIELIAHGSIHEIKLARPPVNALNYELLDALVLALSDAQSLAVGLATMTSALPHVRRHRHLLTTLPFIKAAITTGVPSTGVCHGFLSAQNLFCYTSSALGLALESGTSGRAHVELSY